jgi:hypothetical protein
MSATHIPPSPAQIIENSYRGESTERRNERQHSEERGGTGKWAGHAREGTTRAWKGKAETEWMKRESKSRTAKEGR